MIKLHKLNKLNKIFFVGLLLLSGITITYASEPSSWDESKEVKEVRVSKNLARALRKYDEVRDFHDGLAFVAKVQDLDEPGYEGTYGYININGEEVVPCTNYYYQYAISPDFSEGLAGFKAGDKYGYINTKGELVIDAIYDKVTPFSDGLALVAIDDSIFFIDREGNKVLDWKWDYPFAIDCDGVSYYDFKNGMIEVEYNGKSGMVNKKGEYIIPPKYHRVGTFSEGLIALESNGKWGFVNSQGETVIPFKYEVAGNFNDGLAPVAYDKHYLNGKYGYINKKGEVVIPFIYDYARDFEDGLAIIEKADKYGVINKNGEEVIPCTYSYISPFREGYAVARKNDTHYFIDIKGKVLTTLGQGYYISDFSEGIALIYKKVNINPTLMRRHYDAIDKFGNSTFEFK